LDGNERRILWMTINAGGWQSIVRQFTIMTNAMLYFETLSMMVMKKLRILHLR